MRAFVLLNQEGVEIRAVESATPDNLGPPIEEGQAWIEVPVPITQHTVKRVDGELIFMQRQRSPAKQLDIARGTKRMELNNARSSAEYAHFVFDGSSFDADADSQRRIAGAVQLAGISATVGQPYSVNWTLADNTVRTLSGAEMIGVGIALGQHVQAAHETAQTLKAQLDAATTLEEVAAITWPQE
jgi:hypothetical protein